MILVTTKLSQACIHIDTVYLTLIMVEAQNIDMGLREKNLLRV